MMPRDAYTDKATEGGDIALHIYLIHSYTYNRRNI